TEQETPPPAPEPETPPVEAAPAEPPVPAAPVEPPKPAAPPAKPAPPPVPVAHKTEVKHLVKRSEVSAGKASTQVGNGGATAEDLRRAKSSPLVRRIADEHGIDIKQLEGTGMSGRVTKNDILSFIESGTPARQPAATQAAGSSKPAPSQAAPAAQPAPTLKPAEGDRVE